MHVSASEEEGDGFPSLETIRENLRRQPKPNRPVDYNLTEVDFWRHWHVPPGSVIEYQDPNSFAEDSPQAAVYVLETDPRPHGIWLKVKSLGAATPEEKKRVDTFFRGSKKRVHLCYLHEDRCPVEGEEALHLLKFRWHPPGDFGAEWLTSAGRKLVAAGKALELEATGKGQATPHDSGKGAGGGPISDIERRLGALRKTGPRVTWSDSVAPPSSRPRREHHREREAGAGGHTRASPSRVEIALAVKKEDVEIVESDHSTSRKGRTKKKSKRDLGNALVAAARLRNNGKTTDKGKRSRSRSRTRKKKKRHRSHSSQSESDSRSSGAGSSSDESLIAPLKKRSRRSPGSVFKMLEETAIERLASDGVVEDELVTSGAKPQRPKIQTYFQIILKPLLDAKSRDCREMSMLARCIDLLRDGQLAILADVLSARFVAIDTATKQGWQTAKHLEVFGEDEESSVPAHVLLSAQKHARRIEKAGGKGSWGRAQTWYGESWQPENRPKGKGKEGKGKTKKGKGKGKGPKGNWGYWGGDGKDKPGEKPKKGEGET